MERDPEFDEAIRVMTEAMEGVAGISRPSRRRLPGRGPRFAPYGYLPVEYAPLRRKGRRAVRSPSLTARFFDFNWLKRARPIALHEGSGRAMVMEVLM